MIENCLSFYMVMQLFYGGIVMFVEEKRKERERSAYVSPKNTELKYFPYSSPMRSVQLKRRDFRCIPNLLQRNVNGNQVIQKKEMDIDKAEFKIAFQRQLVNFSEEDQEALCNSIYNNNATGKFDVEQVEGYLQYLVNACKVFLEMAFIKYPRNEFGIIASAFTKVSDKTVKESVNDFVKNSNRINEGGEQYYFSLMKAGNDGRVWTDCITHYVERKYKNSEGIPVDKEYTFKKQTAVLSEAVDKKSDRGAFDTYKLIKQYIQKEDRVEERGEHYVVFRSMCKSELEMLEEYFRKKVTIEKKIEESDFSVIGADERKDVVKDIAKIVRPSNAGQPEGKGYIGTHAGNLRQALRYRKENEGAGTQNILVKFTIRKKLQDNLQSDKELLLINKRHFNVTGFDSPYRTTAGNGGTSTIGEATVDGYIGIKPEDSSEANSNKDFSFSFAESSKLLFLTLVESIKAYDLHHVKKPQMLQ